MAKNYRDLIVWQKSMDLAVDTYRTVADLPPTEKYGLRSQMQRSAYSIPTNIAEGYGRRRRGEYLQHLSYARGSLAELETQLILVGRLEMLTRHQVKPLWDQADEVGRMLQALMTKLENEPE